MRLTTLTFTLVLAASTALAATDRPDENHDGRWWTNSHGCEYVRSTANTRPEWFLISSVDTQSCPKRIAPVKYRGLKLTAAPKK